MDDIARLDSNIASVEMEGFTVTPETRELLMRCIRKEMTYDEAIDSIIASYVPQT
ncbi:MAG: antitoxin VbhA family protein [Candidatus Methanomethylophilaceae archaeon]|nr:antitoxin VbhA family protein [Candidatus Methanomethylophilaceae archaeon]